MRTDTRAQIESMLDDYRALTARLDQLHADLAKVAGTASSSDGRVTATVGSHGDLVGLRIDDDAPRRLTAQALAACVIEATRHAAATARHQVSAMVTEVLPERVRSAIGTTGEIDLTRLLPRDPTNLDILGGGR